MRSLISPSPLSEGRYLLGTPLGEGGMAVVWRGFDTALQIPCAVKILNRVLCSNEGLRARFLIEAQTMAKLRHPNIVAVQNLGEEDGCPYIVMEILEGSVSALVDASGPMPTPLALEVLTATLRALDFAHSHGVVHRDVKPANILFSEDRTFKLTDFGIARLQETNHALTRTGVSLGTWGFMAPEQRKNSRHVDHRADIYAAGATLYAMVVGAAPVDLFTADRDETVLSEVPEVLQPVIARATSYRPEDRFPDAAAMCEALEAIRQQLPPEETPYSFDLTPPPLLLQPSAEDAPVEPDLQEPAATSDHAMTGHGLAELLDEADTPASRKWPLALGVAVVVLLLGVLTRPLWQAEPPVVSDESTGEILDAPEVETPELVDELEPEPVVEPESKPEPVIRSKPTVSPEPEDEPEPAPKAPKTGRISVRGDATMVQLKDASGALHSAGKLPPGSYVILAAFEDGSEFPAGTLELSSGQRLTVRCDSVFATCTVR